MKKVLNCIGALFCLALVASCNKTNNNNDDPIEEKKTYKVTFKFHDESTKVVEVIEGDKVTSIGDDSLCEESECKFMGWYLNNTLYDFDSLVTSDLELVSKCTPFSEISVSVRYGFSSLIENSDVYVERDGSLTQYNNNNYFLSLKDYEKRFTLKYNDEFKVSLPFTSLKNSSFSDTFKVYDSNNNYLFDCKNEDTFKVKGDYVILVESTFNEIEVTIDGVSKEKISVSGNYVVPVNENKSNDTSKKFLGYKLDDSRRIYHEGEVLYSDELEDYEALNFTSYYVDISNMYHIASIEDYISFYEEDNEDSDVVVSLDIDLDFTDEYFGPGIVCFNGTFLGNNHTIKNANINSDDSNDGNGVGLIQFSDSGCNIYDLTMENTTLNALASYGMGAIIGEADSYVNLYNVHSKGTRIGEINLNKYGYEIDGISGFIGTLGSASIVNCSSTDFSFDIDRDTLGEANKYQNLSNINTGGLIGRTYYSDFDAFYGLNLKDNEIKDISISTHELNSVNLGGIGGYIEADYNGSFLIHNNISNISLTIDKPQKKEKNSIDSRLGGMFGYYEEYSLLYDSDNNIVRKNLCILNEVSNCVLKNELSSEVSNISTDIITSTGLFSGDHYVNIGSNQKNDVKGISIYSRNKLSGSISINSYDEELYCYAGGFNGVYAQDTKGRSAVYFENNEINVNAEIIGTSQSVSRIGGFSGYFVNEGRDGSYVSSNVIKGELYNDLTNEYYVEYSNSVDPSYTNAGIIGLMLNGDAYVEISDNISLIYSWIDTSFYASNIFCAHGNAYGYSESAEYVEGNCYASNKSLGKDASSKSNVISISETRDYSYILNSNIWEITDSEVTLKTY